MFLFFQPEQFPQVVHSFVVLAVKGFIFADRDFQSLAVCFHSWSVVSKFRPLLCKVFLPTPKKIQRQHQFRVRRGRICPRDFRVGVCKNAINTGDVFSNDKVPHEFVWAFLSPCLAEDFVTLLGFFRFLESP